MIQWFRGRASPSGMYQKPFGAGNTGRFFKLGLEKSIRLTYNMLDKVADTIAYTYPFPA